MAVNSVSEKTTRTGQIFSIFWFIGFLAGLALMIPDVFDFYFVPSEFRKTLSETPIYWHTWRWVYLTLSVQLSVIGFAATAIIFGKVFGQRLGRILRDLSAVVVSALMMIALSVLIYADSVGGYAIYSDHIIARVPFLDPKPVTYRTTDIDHIEVGCRVRFLGFGSRRSGFMPIPIYDLHMRNGRVFPLTNTEVQSGNVRLSDLSSAIVAFDSSARKDGVPRRSAILTKGDLKKLSGCLTRHARYAWFQDPAEITRAFSVK